MRKRGGAKKRGKKERGRIREVERKGARARKGGRGGDRKKKR